MKRSTVAWLGCLLVLALAIGASRLSAEPEPLGSIEGVALDPDGKPVSGLRVVALQLEREDADDLPEIRESGALTDDKGRYAIEDLANGRWLVAARGPRHVTQGLAKLLAEPSEWGKAAVAVEGKRPVSHELRVELGVAITGRITDASGQPVEGLTVHGQLRHPLTSRSALTFARFLLADRLAAREGKTRGGRFTLDAFPRGSTAEITASTPYFPEPTWTIEVPPEGRVEALTAQLLPWRWVDVRTVEAETGTPMPNTDLEGLSLEEPASAMFREQLDGLVPLGIETNARGLARVGLVEGFRYALAADGARREDQVEITVLPANRPMPPVNLPSRLSPGDVHLRFTAPPGTSSGQVHVHFGDERDGFREQAQVPLGSHWRVPRWRVDRGDTLWIEAYLLCPEGAFSARHRVDLHKSSRASVALEPLALDEGYQVVRILDNEGQPVRDARVRCAQITPGVVLDPTGTEPLAEGKTGEWLLRAKNQSLWVGASAPPSRGLGARTRLVERTKGVLSLQLPGAASVTGRVVDEQGEPLAGQIVSARIEGNLAIATFLDLPRPEAISDASGRFQIDGLGDQPHVVTVKARGNQAPPRPTRVSPSPGGSTDVGTITVRAYPPVEILVIDETGQPVVGAEIIHVGLPTAPVDEIDPSNVEHFISETNRKGIAVLQGLDPSAVRMLTVMPPQSRPELLRTMRLGWRPKDTTITMRRKKAK